MKKKKKKNCRESKVSCCWSSFTWQRILLKTTIKDLHKESVRLGYETEKVSKPEAVKLMVIKSNALKGVVNVKQVELHACVESKRPLLEQKSAIDA